MKLKYNTDNAEHLERKLKNLEEEVSKYKEEKRKEQEERKRKEDEKATRIKRKKQKEKHWQMVRWLTQFIEENKNSWKEREEEMRKVHLPMY